MLRHPKGSSALRFTAIGYVDQPPVLYDDRGVDPAELERRKR